MNRPTYRVELHRDGKVALLGRLTEARPHFRTLDPYLSQLTREGIDGWLVLVDETTNKIVARRRLAARHRPDPNGSPDPQAS